MKRLSTSFVAFVLFCMSIEKAYAIEFNVLVISIITEGHDALHDTRRRLHFKSTEECMEAQRALNKSVDLPNEQPDEVYFCDNEVMQRSKAAIFSSLIGSLLGT
jgi:hypothetical protein